MPFLLITVLLCAHATVATPLTDFFRALAREFHDPFTAAEAGAFASFCEVHGLDPTSASNEAAYHEVAFLHALLTGDGARDGVRGGLLQIPYFWHWITPNPRHDILLVADDRPLASTPPPDPYSRYATQADIDRVPVLYLGDLVAEQPRYRHPRYGPFETFGWCSEREMAFLSLMLTLGYDGKVVQEGIHVWTELWCEMTTVDGDTVVMTAHVDNTFATLRWRQQPEGTTLQRWRAQTGRGAQVDWYNRTARSPVQLDGLRGLEVGEGAAARIRARVSDGLTQAP